MRNFLGLFILLLSVSVTAQDIQYKQFKSAELGRTRELKIYIPPTYHKDSTKLYPLTIILDGEELFDIYLGNMELFAKRDLAPEQILVGILQENQTERYAETAVDKVSGLPTEDSEAFYRFIRGELLDDLESKYRLSPFRTIVGSTVSANFLNFFLIENDLAFDAFVNINPYYSPDMYTFLENKLNSVNREQVYYYVNSGKYNGTDLHKSIEQVAYMIKNMDNPNVKVKYDLFDNSTKTSSIGQAVPSAIAHIFSGYAYISPEEFDLNIKHLSPPDAIDYVKKKYVDIEYLFGTNLKIRERDIYAIESIVIDEENGRYLGEFSDMIKDLYPESPLSDYYLGMYYEKQGKYSQALKNYKNGYAKMSQNPEKAEAFYQNIERVQGRADEAIEMQEAEKEERETKKEEWKSQKQADKEMMEKYRKKDDK